jgi:hypothetical protein
MAANRIKCTIVEVVGDHVAGADPASYSANEVLPWTDPFIAQLLARQRLRAALDDSLTFLQSAASHDVAPREERVIDTPRRRGPRFNIPLDDELQSNVEGWPW